MSSSTTQYGFFFDQSRCTGCQACAVSCKDWNGINPGPTQWLRILNYEKGSFPNVRIHLLFVPCYHCANPVCVDVANGAIYKEPAYGAVLVDPDKAHTLRAAAAAGPYGAISFEGDAYDAKGSKCTMCVDRLSQNLQPACVMACPTRALDFGKLSDLKAKYGNSSDLEDLPSSTETSPSVVFRASAPKQQVVPYDATNALALLSKRDPLPPILSDPGMETDLQDYVKKSKPVLKPASTAELKYGTQNDNA